jgi:hypothetical protein
MMMVPAEMLQVPLVETWQCRLRTSPCCVLRTTGKPLWVVLRSAHLRSLICIFSCSRDSSLVNSCKCRHKAALPLVS